VTTHEPSARLESASRSRDGEEQLSLLEKATRPSDGRRDRDDRGVIRAFAATGTAVLVVAAMSLARPILIPFVLAVFLAFVLSPTVGLIERRGAGRILAVVIVAGLAFSLLGVVFYGLARQLSVLGDELPHYESNLRARVVIAMRA